MDTFTDDPWNEKDYLMEVGLDPHLINAYTWSMDTHLLMTPEMKWLLDGSGVITMSVTVKHHKLEMAQRFIM